MSSVTNISAQPLSRDFSHVLHNTKALEHQDLAEPACKDIRGPQALSLGTLCFTTFLVAKISKMQSALSCQELSTTHSLTAIVQQKNKANSPKCLKTEIWLGFSLKATQRAGKPQPSLTFHGTVGTKTGFDIVQQPGRRVEL